LVLSLLKAEFIPPALCGFEVPNCVKIFSSEGTDSIRWADINGETRGVLLEELGTQGGKAPLRYFDG
jgi:hypothetical protein